MKNYKKGTIFFAILIVFFVVLGILIIKRPPPPPPNKCERLETEINIMFGDVSYCDTDDDCARYRKYPFVHRLYNKNADLSEIESKVDFFYKDKCVEETDYTGLDGDLYCMNNKCLDFKSPVIVINGDTIDIVGDKIRYIGLDAPKLAECFGEDAHKKNEELIEGRMLRFGVSESGIDKDEDDQFLRYVYAGDIFINDYLIREGYAYASNYDNQNTKYFLQFQEAQKEAKENNRGLWGECE